MATRAYCGAHERSEIVLLLGDCLEQMKTLADNSVDAVVTDPPYGLAFMNKKWDYDVPSVDVWREVYRVLKPGGHVLSFGGTRTYHRMVVNIEDAGFEIRDQVQWIYGSGFPKSHNVSKAIAKLNGEELVSIGEGRSGSSNRAYQSEDKTTAGKYKITKADNEWDGWGSALKPANEPICLARKPLEKGLTLAENVLKYGTGAINVDGCRIESKPRKTGTKAFDNKSTGSGSSLVGSSLTRQQEYDLKDQGRWPANVLFDEDAAEMLDAQSGNCKGFSGGGGGKTGIFKTGKVLDNYQTYNDSGGASRFFYVAKASKRERNAGCDGMPEKRTGDFRKGGAGNTRSEENYSAMQNHHPTVKPIKLMEYLITLITPPNGTVLDPFMGSGSTGVACKNLSREFIGCEMSPEYYAIAQKRIEHVNQNKQEELL